MPNIGVPELLIILVVALLLFGGSRLAGLGKGVGRSIREFKEEVKAADSKDQDKSSEPEVVEAEIVDYLDPVSWRPASRPSRRPR